VIRKIFSITLQIWKHLHYHIAEVKTQLKRLEDVQIVTETEGLLLEVLQSQNTSGSQLLNCAVLVFK